MQTPYSGPPLGDPSAFRQQPQIPTGGGSGVTPTPRQRGSVKWLALGVVVVVIAGLGWTLTGGDDKKTETSASTKSPPAKTDDLRTVELGDRPEVEPVEAILTAANGPFDTQLFLTAFEPGTASCDTARFAWPDGVEQWGPEPVNAIADVTAVGTTNANIDVNIEGAGTLPFTVKVADGRWVIDGDPCKWFVIFVGAASRATDRAAKSDLRNALAAAKVSYTDTESFIVTPDMLEQIEPSITYGDVTEASETLVGIGDVSDDHLVLVRRSKTGTYFCTGEDINVGTTFGRSEHLADVDTVAECTQGWEDERTDPPPAAA